MFKIFLHFDRCWSRPKLRDNATLGGQPGTPTGPTASLLRLPMLVLSATYGREARQKSIGQSSQIMASPKSLKMLAGGCYALSNFKLIVERDLEPASLIPNLQLTKCPDVKSKSLMQHKNIILPLMLHKN